MELCNICLSLAYFTSIRPSRFIHVVEYDRISLVLMEYPIVHIYHRYFFHSSVNGHLCCFHMWAIAENATMNMEVQILFRDPDFLMFRYMLRISGSYVSFLVLFFF